MTVFCKILLFLETMYEVTKSFTSGILCKLKKKHPVMDFENKNCILIEETYPQVLTRERPPEIDH